jgi:hypothetical protein
MSKDILPRTAYEPGLEICMAVVCAICLLAIPAFLLTWREPGNGSTVTLCYPPIRLQRT